MGEFTFVGLKQCEELCSSHLGYFFIFFFSKGQMAIAVTAPKHRIASISQKEGWTPNLNQRGDRFICKWETVSAKVCKRRKCHDNRNLLNIVLESWHLVWHMVQKQFQVHRPSKQWKSHLSIRAFSLLHVSSHRLSLLEKIFPILLCVTEEHAKEISLDEIPTGGGISKQARLSLHEVQGVWKLFLKRYSSWFSPGMRKA